MPAAQQRQPRFTPLGCGKLLVVRHLADFFRAVGRAGGNQAMQQEGVEEAQGLRVDAHGLERVEVKQTHLHVLHPPLAQGVQRPFALVNGAFGADGAVKLVFDLQQRGGQLQVVTAGVDDAQCLVRGPRPGERVVQAGGVAVQAVVTDAQRRLCIALVTQAPHAQRRAVRHVQRPLGERLQCMLAPLHKRTAQRG